FASDQQVLLQTLYFACSRTMAALAFVGPTILVLAHRATPATKKLLVVCMTLLLGFAAVTPYKPEYYVIYVTPPVSLMLASFMAQIPQLAWPRWRVNLLAFFTWTVVLASVVFGFDRLRANPTAEYQAALGVMQRAIPADAGVMGSGYF